MRTSKICQPIRARVSATVDVRGVPRHWHWSVVRHRYPVYSSPMPPATLGLARYSASKNFANYDVPDNFEISVNSWKATKFLLKKIHENVANFCCLLSALQPTHPFAIVKNPWSPREMWGLRGGGPDLNIFKEGNRSVWLDICDALTL